MAFFKAWGIDQATGQLKAIEDTDSIALTTADDATITLADQVGNTTLPYVFFNFHNVTANARFGSDGYNADPDAGSLTTVGEGWNEIPSPIAVGYIRVAANTSVTVQLRIGSLGGGGGTGTIRQLAGQTSVDIMEIKD